MVSREAFILKDEMVQSTESFDSKQDVTSQFERYLELGENALTQYERAAQPAVEAYKPSQQEDLELAALEKRQTLTLETNKVLRARRQTAESQIKALETQVVYFKTRADYYAAELALVRKENAELRKENLARGTELQQLKQTIARMKRETELNTVAQAKDMDAYFKWRDNHPTEFEPKRSGRNPWEYQAVQRMPYLLELKVPEAQSFPSKNQ